MKKQKLLAVSPDMHKLIKKLKAETGMSLQAITDRAIAFFAKKILKKKGKK